MGELPRRVQLSRAKGWRMPENTVKVDRTTRWGNPWRLHDNDSFGTGDTAQEVVRRFRAATVGFMSNGSLCRPQAAPDSYIGRIIRDAHNLKGKNLACWCKLDAPCHADVLLELANRNTEAGT